MEFNIKGNVRFKGETIQTRELLAQVKQVRLLLQRKSILGDGIVALAMNRTPGLIVAIFALLNENITFLPIDVGLPPERLRYMLDKADIDVIVTDKDDLRNRLLWEKEIVTIGLEDGKDVLEDVPVRDVDGEIAYLLFTSGTTGKPKAVEVYRKGFVNFLSAILDRIDFPEPSVMACFTNETFDIFFLESVFALCTGMTVALADADERSNPRKMISLMQKEHVNIIQMTPSALHMLQFVDKELNCLARMEVILVGGEAFPLKLLKLLQSNTSARIYNMYGPTETTIWSSIADLTKRDEIVIGSPILNTEIYIMDEENKVLSEDEEGEIGIAGVGLAKGYYNDAEHTAKAFQYLIINGERKRIYKTGDLGRYSKGELVYLGRKDQQVKILGHRIEMEEVEESIRDVKGVKDSVVGVMEDGVNKRLACFYISDQEIKEQTLISQLSEYLPDYMMPSRFVRVPRFLYTSSNKIDRKAMVREYGEGRGMEANPAKRLKKEKGVPEKVTEVFMAVIGREDASINEETNLDEWIKDSLAYIKLIVSLEECFSIEFNDEVLERGYWKNVSEVIMAVEELLSK